MFHALIHTLCSNKKEFQWLIHHNHANFLLFIFINCAPNISNFTASVTYLKGVQLKKEAESATTLHDILKKDLEKFQTV